MVTLDPVLVSKATTYIHRLHTWYLLGASFYFQTECMRIYSDSPTELLLLHKLYDGPHSRLQLLRNAAAGLLWGVVVNGHRRIDDRYWAT